MATFKIIQNPPPHGAQFAYEHPSGGQLVGYDVPFPEKQTNCVQPLVIKLMNYEGKGTPLVSLTCVEETENKGHPNVVYKWDHETIFKRLKLTDEGRYGSIRQEGDQVEHKEYQLWFKIKRRPVRPRGTPGAPDADAVRIKVQIHLEMDDLSLTDLGHLCTMPIYNKYADDCRLHLEAPTAHEGHPGQKVGVSVVKRLRESSDQILVKSLQIYFVDGIGNKFNLPEVCPQNTKNVSTFLYTVPSRKNLPNLIENYATVRVTECGGKCFAAYRFKFTAHTGND